MGHAALLALRILALVVAACGLVQVVTVILFYVRHSLLPPRRLLHIITVGIGVALAYVQLLTDLVVRLHENVPFGWASPRVLVASLFIIVGVRWLWLDAKERIKR